MLYYIREFGDHAKTRKTDNSNPFSFQNWYERYRLAHSSETSIFFIWKKS